MSFKFSTYGRVTPLLMVMIVGCTKVESDGGQYTYVAQANGSMKKVSFVAVNGFAVVENDVMLGTVARAEAIRREVESERGGRAGVTSSLPDRRWSEGRIPYVIDPDLADLELKLGDRARIQPAIDLLFQTTGIMFVPLASRPGSADYIVFQRSATTTASYVGRQGGPQPLLLGDLADLGAVAHELGHATGLYHEHSRNDRDQFVRINWDNIHPADHHHFNQPLNEGTDRGTYDPGSIMHYGLYAFSINNLPTITLLPGATNSGNKQVTVGQRLGFSPGDVRTIMDHALPSGCAPGDTSPATVNNRYLRNRYDSGNDDISDQDGDKTHVISVYSGVKTGERTTGMVRVRVRKSKSPIKLVLASYEAVDWVLTLAPGARISRVILVNRDSTVRVEARPTLAEPSPQLELPTFPVTEREYPEIPFRDLPGSWNGTDSADTEPSKRSRSRNWGNLDIRAMITSAWRTAQNSADSLQTCLVGNELPSSFESWTFNPMPY